MLHFPLGQAAAEAHLDQGESRAGAGAFRRERAVAAQAVVRVDDLPVPVQGDGDAAAHVGHDRRHVIARVAVLAEVSADDGAGIQGVEEGAAREIGETADVALREHLVGHRRVRDVGHAGGAADAALAAEGRHFGGDVIGDHGRQVAGMDAVAAGKEHLAHIGIDPVHAGHGRGEQAAARHHDVDVAEAHARLPEEIHDDAPPEVALLQHAVEPQHLLGAEFQIPDQDGVPVHIIPHLGRCRPRVDGQYLSFHVFPFSV